MSVRIRLQRKGRKKAPFYHIVAADARSPRDGRFIEKLGTYNPLTVPATIELSRERAYYWLSVGAEPTDTVNAILRYKGVLYFKHLMRGLKKGALTQEQVDAQMNTWIEQKEGAVAAAKAKEDAKRAAHRIAVDGTPKAKPQPVPEPVAEEPVAEASTEAAAETETETPAAE